jgi:hypothetical protein
MRTSRAAGFIASFKTTPLEIFRVNKGPHISLREWAAFPPHRSSIFDLHTYEGTVLPKALDKATYQCKLLIIYLSSYLTSILVPNGASMRPNGRYQQGLVRRLAGGDWIVYSVPKGWLSPWTKAYTWHPQIMYNLPKLQTHPFPRSWSWSMSIQTITPCNQLSRWVLKVETNVQRSWVFPVLIIF